MHLITKHLSSQLNSLGCRTKDIAREITPETDRWEVKETLYKTRRYQGVHGLQSGKPTSAHCASDSVLVSSPGRGPVSPVPLLDRVAFIFSISF